MVEKVPRVVTRFLSSEEKSHVSIISSKQPVEITTGGKVIPVKRL